MNGFKLLVSFMVCIWCMGDLASQIIPLSQLHFKRYGLNEGLNNKQINCIYQSKDGMLWLGGNQLQRFDGHRFIAYNIPNINLAITHIFEDEHQRLFIVDNFFDIYSFDRSKEIFTREYLFNTDEFIRNDFKIIQVFNGKNGRLIFNLEKAIGYLDMDTDKAIKIVSSPFDMGNHIIGSASIDMENNVWAIIRPIGIFRLNTETFAWTYKEQNKKAEDIFDVDAKDLITILKDNTGNFWFIHKKAKVLKYNPTTNRKTEYTISYANSKNIKSPNTFIAQITKDKKGEIWVTPGEFLGIAKYSKTTDNLEILYTDKTKSYGLSDDIMMGSFGNLYEDKQGTFWMFGQNLWSFNPYSQSTVTVETSQLSSSENNSKTPKTLQGATPSGFVRMNDGRMYVSYYGAGIVSFDEKLSNPISIALPDMVSSLIWSIFSADGQILYFTDQNKLLFSYNIVSKKIIRISDSKYQPRYTNMAFVENDTTAWLAHPGYGMTKMNPNKLTFTHYENIAYPQSIEGEAVHDIHQEGQNFLWLATEKSGLVLFDKRAGKSIKNFSLGKNSPLVFSVYDIVSRSDSILLLATTYGVIILDKKTFCYDIIDMKNGLNGLQCASLAMQEENNVLINTFYNGVYNLNLTTLQCQRIGHDYEDNFIRGDKPTFITKYSDIIFSHNNGFTVFKSPEIEAKGINSIYITKFLVNDQLMVPELGQNENAPIYLPYTKNNIYLSFSTLHLHDIQNTNYYIKIDGINDKWEILKNKGEIEYKNLSPGDYKIHIKASTPFSNRVSATKTIHLIIEAPFYYRWWFILLMAGLLSTIIMMYERKKRKEILALEILKSDALNKELEIEKQQRDMEEIKNKLTELKLSNLQSRMNPHFIFNTLNSINSYVIKNDIHKTSDYISKFSKLIRLILDHSKEENISLHEELETVKLYLHIESLRMNNNFDFTIDIDKNIITENIMIPPMLIQPFVENAIWHGLMPSKKEKHVTIKVFNKADDILTIQIDDNGIGRLKSSKNKLTINEHQSQGMALTAQRLQYMNANNSIEIIDKTDDQNNALGTLVSISLHHKNQSS